MDLWPGGDGWLCGPGAVLWSTGENGDFGKSSTWETVLVADHKHIPFIAVCPIATLRGRQHTKAECKSQDGHESHRWRDRVSFKNRCVRRSQCWHQLPLQERQGQTRLWDLCCFPMDWRKCVTRQTTICSCLDSWWYCWSGGYYNLVRLVSFLSFFVENCLDAVEPVWVAGVDPHLLGPESGSTAFDTSSAVLLGQTQACVSNSEYSKLVWGQCGKDPCCKQGIIFAVPSSCYSKEHPWRGCSEPVCVTLQGFWSGWARKSFPLRGVICSSFWRRMWTLRAATNLQAFVRKGSMVPYWDLQEHGSGSWEEWVGVISPVACLCWRKPAVRPSAHCQPRGQHSQLSGQTSPNLQPFCASLYRCLFQHTTAFSELFSSSWKPGVLWPVSATKVSVRNNGRFYEGETAEQQQYLRKRWW